MNLSTESVVCRVIEPDNFISVTHTLKDESGRRVSDVQSVTELVETWPSLDEPTIEAIPYEAEYYDKWARVVRNDAASRASLRPVTVTAKSWALLHAIPTPSQSRLETPASPRRQAVSTNSPISSCKSLDSIIDHYNQLFPPESQTSTKTTLKVTHKNQKDTPTKTDSQSKTKNESRSNTRSNSDSISTNENSQIDSLLKCYPDGKTSPKAVSPNRNLSTSSSSPRSPTPDPNSRTDRSSRKNSLQVPLPTGLVNIQWPPTLSQQSTTSFNSTQFPMCVPKRSSGSRSPRLRSPEPSLGAQDPGSHQSPNRTAVSKLDDVNHNQLPAYKNFSKRNSERRLSYNSANGNLHLGSISPRRLSARLYSSTSSEELVDFKPDEVKTNTFPNLGVGLSPETPRNNYTELGLEQSQRNTSLVAITSASLPKSPDGRYFQQNCSTLKSQPEGLHSISNVNNESHKKCSKPHHKRRSRKSSRDEVQTLSGERQRSSRSRYFMSRQDGQPMVQLLDFEDLKIIFDRAASIQKRSGASRDSLEVLSAKEKSFHL